MAKLNELTIKEAIERFTSNAEYERTNGNLQGCLAFRQLVEWLKDYKRLLDQDPCEDIAKAFQIGLAFGFGENHNEMDRVIDEIKKVITPQPKTGHWIECKILNEVKCSNCRMCFGQKSNYCPNCGAEMKEGK